MSHVVATEVELHNVAAIKAACEELGLEFKEGQKTYEWWGFAVGDYPLPTGFTKEDLGKCEHAIGIPGTTWEVGVCRSKSTEGYTLMFDFFGKKGQPILAALGGEKQHKFLQSYAIHNTRMFVEKKNGSFRLTKMANNVQRAEIEIEVDV